MSYKDDQLAFKVILGVIVTIIVGTLVVYATAGAVIIHFVKKFW
jgi:uncharacterized membrane protein YccC